jgi:endonuclease/exonuclease/phosphatase family metal-dependent hydrolase
VRLFNHLRFICSGRRKKRRSRTILSTATKIKNKINENCYILLMGDLNTGTGNQRLGKSTEKMESQLFLAMGKD